MCGRITLTTKPSHLPGLEGPLHFEFWPPASSPPPCGRSRRGRSRRGQEKIAPYWRVITNDGALNEKFPGGDKSHAELLKAEGFRVDAAGKSTPRTADFQKHIVKW